MNGLVRVQTSGTSQLRIARHFGKNDVACVPNPNANPMVDAYLYNCTITDDASNCDLNHDGKVDFGTEPEKSCGNACTGDLECTDWTSFIQRGNFVLVETDTGNNISGKIQGNATSTAAFNPYDRRGQAIRSFTGTLRYFSGGSQYTIEARCTDDIVTDLNAFPLPMDKACVFPRTFLDTNSGSQ
jgi:hypothetical protein